MLRMAFSIDNMQIGGTELNAVRTAERLGALGVDICLIALQEEGPLMDRYARAGIPVRAFPPGPLYGAAARSQARALYRYLRKSDIQLVHAHDMYSNIFVVPVARLAGIPAVIGSRRWWEGPPHRLQRSANRISYRFAHAVLANSDGVGRMVVREEGVSVRRVHVVRNHLEESAFQRPSPEERVRWKAALGLPADVPIVGCVANLHPGKGHEDLIRAFAGHVAPPTVLALVGDGVRRSAAEDLTRELDVTDRVLFLGRQPNLPNVHHLFTVATLASESEGLPNVLLEAMAAGCPVVATAVGGVPDAVDDTVGILVPPRDPNALGLNLSALLSDPQRCAVLGAAGHQRAREEYSADVVLRELLTLYGKLLPDLELPPLKAHAAAAETSAAGG